MYASFPTVNCSSVFYNVTLGITLLTQVQSHYTSASKYLLHFTLISAQACLIEEGKCVLLQSPTRQPTNSIFGSVGQFNLRWKINVTISPVC